MSDSEIRQFRAILDGEEFLVPREAGKTLLDSMLDDGLDPPFQCMDAHCGSCMVLKLAGEVDMRKHDVLSKRDLEQGYVLLCQSIPLTEDLLVDCDA